MIDSLFTAALTLCLGLGGALAIGSTFIDTDNNAGALQGRSAVAPARSVALDETRYETREAKRDVKRDMKRDMKRDAPAGPLARNDRTEAGARRVQ